MSIMAISGGVTKEAMRRTLAMSIMAISRGVRKEAMRWTLTRVTMRTVVQGTGKGRDVYLRTNPLPILATRILLMSIPSHLTKS